MTATNILTMIATMAGGLVFFLYGMSVMSGGLEKMTGGSLERTLKSATSNYFMSFLLGAGITIAIQSSSAMTVMLVGLVNSGIMEFAQTFGAIMGSNVGTTLTSWLLSLNGINGNSIFFTMLQPTIFAPILALFGIGASMFSKKEKYHNIGNMLVGFAILIIGMDLMSGSVSSIKDYDGFGNLLGLFKNPIVAVLISTLFTAVIQSSAATVGIIQAMALAGGMTYQMAIPLVLGANIGTCMTALLASFGTNRNAKRVIYIHIYINVIGTVICLIALGIFNLVMPGYTSVEPTMFGVALIHTIFNLLNTVILSPLRKYVLKLVVLTVPYKKEEKDKAVFLDERLLNTPVMAAEQCFNLTCEMADIAKRSLFDAIGLIFNYNEEKAKEISENEELVDTYEDKLGTYLVKLSANDLSEQTSRDVGRLLHSIGDFERISDHAVNILGVAKEIKEKKIVFSEEARNEIDIITSAVTEIVDITVESFRTNNDELAAKVEPLEQVIDDLKKSLQQRHVKRLQDGRCTIKLGFVFSDLINNYERVSDHCSNIAISTLQREAQKQYVHRYSNSIKNDGDGGFAASYGNYGKKYALPSNNNDV